MSAQTGGHSLPGGEGTAGSQCMNFDSFLSTHDVQRSDGCCAGRNVCNIAGLTEGAVQGVLHDGHGVQLDDLSGLVQPLFNVTAADELGDGIDECHVACPTGRGGSDVSTAFGDVVDDLGVVLDILIGGEVDMKQSKIFKVHKKI